MAIAEMQPRYRVHRIAKSRIVFLASINVPARVARQDQDVPDVIDTWTEVLEFDLGDVDCTLAGGLGEDLDGLLAGPANRHQWIGARSAFSQKIHGDLDFFLDLRLNGKGM